MIIQLVTNHPEAILQILRHTPVWVWGLLVTLLAVGASQMRSRQVGLRRAFIMPLGMLVLGVSGILADLGHNAQGGISAAPLLAWALAASATALLLAPFAPPAGTWFDAEANTFHLPGSVQPLALIVWNVRTQGKLLVLSTRMQNLVARSLSAATSHRQI